MSNYGGNGPHREDTAACLICGENLNPGDKFCFGCGTPVSSASDLPIYPLPDHGAPVCPFCGAGFDAGDMFCTGCGTPVGSVSAQPMQPQPLQPQPIQPQSLHPQPAPHVYRQPVRQKKKKNPVPVILALVCAAAIGAGVYIYLNFFNGNDNDNGSGDPAGDRHVQHIPDQTQDTPEVPDKTPGPATEAKPEPTLPPKPANGGTNNENQDTEEVEYIVIDNPKIVITTRFNPATNEFNSQDAHARSVELAGGIAVLAEDDPILAHILSTGDVLRANEIAASYDGLILSGGGDISARFFGQTRHPASAAPDEVRDKAEIELCRAFINAGKPVLGINRGMQVLNVTLEGDLIQDIPDLLGIDSSVHSGNNIHTIDILTDTWLYDLFGSSLNVSSSHHQALGVIAEGFKIAAIHGLVVEAIQYNNLLGIQFNPERLDASASRAIFNDFIQRCSIYYLPT